ncbi:SurA N-terminal domain-containing protein [Kitasatospora sp. NPDC054939]
MRRRTVAAAVAGAVLAAAVLAGCAGGGLSGGTAVVLDGRRVPVGAVEARVAQLRHAAGGGSADARAQPDGLARRAVAELVLDAVVARAAADRGLVVTDAEVAAVRAAEGLRHGGPEQLAAALARQGIPASGIDDHLRQQLGIRRLVDATGPDAGTPVGDAAVRAALADAAGALHLRINPRYGTWDARRSVLLPDTPPWFPALD